jgi:predicted lipid-binding transport protein (Tim44 family)
LTHLRRALLVAALLLAAHAALARPGGGHSYSGGSRGGGGGGSSSHSSGGGFRSSGGGGGTVVEGGSGLCLLIMILAIIMVVIALERPSKGWDSDTGPRPAALMAGAAARSPARGLRELRERDPEFSRVLFDDFAYALFAAGHLAADKPEALARLVPYIGPIARGYLQERAQRRGVAQAVIVGAMRPTSVTLPPAPARPGQYVEVELEFEANLSVERGGQAATRYVVERWTLSRAAGARTRPWSTARTFVCPSCGAPFQATADARCASCGQVVDNGRFDWLVRLITLVRSELRPPALTGTVEEEGTELPTVIDGALATEWASLATDDPALTEDALKARLQLVFAELQAAWRAQDLTNVRPFVSDGMYQYLAYWIDAYRRQGLRNLVDGATLLGWVTARVERDEHYDALTVRIWGSGRDYTVDASGSVVGGSRERDRRYTEYWTLIRGAGVRGKPRTERSCPSCGAELKINMAGNCEYCGVHVTAGEFDWVLSKIEQDDSYEG